MTIAVNASAVAAGSFAGATTAHVTLTTTAANCLLVLCAVAEQSTAPSITSVASTSGLTWNKRTAKTQNLLDIEVWWAVATSAVTSEVITATYAAAPDDYAFVAFGLTGAVNASPWDSNSGVPSFAGLSAAGAPSTTYSTSSANDFVLAVAGTVTSGVTTPIPTGFTALNSTGTSGGSRAAGINVCYEIVSAPQSGTAVTWGASIGGSNGAGLLVDAIRQPSTPVLSRPMQMLLT